MRLVVFLMAGALFLLGCAHNQNQAETPIKQSWVLEYLKGYNEFYNNIKLAEGYEWAEEQTIADNRLSALYYPEKDIVIGQFFSGCNGASNNWSEGLVNNWQMTVTQVACTRRVKLTDGSLQEHVHGSTDIADRVFSKITSKISRQSVDWNAGLLTWHSADGELLAKFKLEAAS